jgi:hypothetical protein
MRLGVCGDEAYLLSFHSTPNCCSFTAEMDGVLLYPGSAQSEALVDWQIGPMLPAHKRGRMGYKERKNVLLHLGHSRAMKWQELTSKSGGKDPASACWQCNR